MSPYDEDDFPCCAGATDESGVLVATTAYLDCSGVVRGPGVRELARPDRPEEG